MESEVLVDVIVWGLSKAVVGNLDCVIKVFLFKSEETVTYDF